jgi:hypothetical protein
VRATRSTRERKQLGNLLRRHSIDNAKHEHAAQLIGQLIIDGSRMSRITLSAI